MGEILPEAGRLFVLRIGPCAQVCNQTEHKNFPFGTQKFTPGASRYLTRHFRTVREVCGQVFPSSVSFVIALSEI